LRDEGQAYADALKDAGVDVFVRNYDGLIHGFVNLFPVSPASEAAVSELFTQFKQRLGQPEASHLTPVGSLSGPDS
jgi:acetyl esterase